MNYYSKKDPKILLFVINRFEDISSYRNDIAPEEEYIQVSARKIPKGLKIKEHKHLINKRTIDYTQEAWVILEGSILAKFYDIDDTLIFDTIINKGDCAILFRGGHSLEALSEKTILYEFKNGPYMGINYDKEDIND